MKMWTVNWKAILSREARILRIINKKIKNSSKNHASIFTYWQKYQKMHFYFLYEINIFASMVHDTSHAVISRFR